MQAHYKTYYKVSRLPAPGNQRFTGADLVICFMVDLGGFAPPSRTLFSLLLPSRSLQQSSIYYQVFLAIQCCICCTRHASPPGSVKNILLPLGVYMVLPSLSTPINPINIISPLVNTSIV